MWHVSFLNRKIKCGDNQTRHTPVRRASAMPRLASLTPAAAWDLARDNPGSVPFVLSWALGEVCKKGGAARRSYAHWTVLRSVLGLVAAGEPRGQVPGSLLGAVADAAEHFSSDDSSTWPSSGISAPELEGELAPSGRPFDTLADAYTLVLKRSGESFKPQLDALASFVARVASCVARRPRSRGLARLCAESLGQYYWAQRACPKPRSCFTTMCSKLIMPLLRMRCAVMYTDAGDDDTFRRLEDVSASVVSNALFHPAHLDALASAVDALVANDAIGASANSQSGNVVAAQTPGSKRKRGTVAGESKTKGKAKRRRGVSGGGGARSLVSYARALFETLDQAVAAAATAGGSPGDSDAVSHGAAFLLEGYLRACRRQQRTAKEARQAWAAAAVAAREFDGDQDAKHRHGAEKLNFRFGEAGFERELGVGLETLGMGPEAERQVDFATAAGLTAADAAALLRDSGQNLTAGEAVRRDRKNKYSAAVEFAVFTRLAQAARGGVAGRVASSAGRLTALSQFYDVARRYGVYSPNRKTADERVTSRLQQHFDAALSAAEKDLEDRVEAGEWSRGEDVGPREAASAAELISSFSRMGAVLVEPKLLRVWQYLWAMASLRGPSDLRPSQAAKVAISDIIIVYSRLRQLPFLLSSAAEALRARGDSKFNFSAEEIAGGEAGAALAEATRGIPPPQAGAMLRAFLPPDDDRESRDSARIPGFMALCGVVVQSLVVSDQNARVTGDALGDLASRLVAPSIKTAQRAIQDAAKLNQAEKLNETAELYADALGVLHGCMALERGVRKMELEAADRCQRRAGDPPGIAKSLPRPNSLVYFAKRCVPATVRDAPAVALTRVCVLYLTAGDWQWADVRQKELISFAFGEASGGGDDRWVVVVRNLLNLSSTISYVTNELIQRVAQRVVAAHGVSRGDRTPAQAALAAVLNHAYLYEIPRMHDALERHAMRTLSRALAGSTAGKGGIIQNEDARSTVARAAEPGFSVPADLSTTLAEAEENCTGAEGNIQFDSVLSALGLLARLPTRHADDRASSTRSAVVTLCLFAEASGRGVAAADKNTIFAGACRDVAMACREAVARVADEDPMAAARALAPRGVVGFYFFGSGTPASPVRESVYTPPEPASRPNSDNFSAGERQALPLSAPAERSTLRCLQSIATAAFARPGEKLKKSGRKPARAVLARVRGLLSSRLGKRLAKMTEKLLSGARPARKAQATVAWLLSRLCAVSRAAFSAMSRGADMAKDSALRKTFAFFEDVGTKTLEFSEKALAFGNISPALSCASTDVYVAMIPVAFARGDAKKASNELRVVATARTPLVLASSMATLPQLSTTTVSSEQLWTSLHVCRMLATALDCAKNLSTETREALLSAALAALAALAPCAAGSAGVVASRLREQMSAVFERVLAQATTGRAFSGMLQTTLHVVTSGGGGSDGKGWALVGLALTWLHALVRHAATPARAGVLRKHMASIIGAVGLVFRRRAGAAVAGSRPAQRAVDKAAEILILILRNNRGIRLRGSHATLTLHTASALLSPLTVHQGARAAQSVEAIFMAAARVLLALIRCRPKLLIPKISAFMKLLATLHRNVMSQWRRQATRVVTKTGGADSKAQDAPPHRCAAALSRVYREMGQSVNAKALNKYVPFAVHAHVESVCAMSLRPAQKKSLESGIFALVDICSQVELAQINATLTDAGKPVFRSLVADYKRRYRFKGDA